MNIAVIGLGYVGLVTGLGLARLGYRVTGIDISRQKVEALRKGQVPFVEPGLEELLAEALRKDRFKASSQPESVRDADIIFLCVGTPSTADGSIDLSGLRKALQDIVGALREDRRDRLIVIRSTVIPGTTQSLVLPLIQEAATLRRQRLGVAVNPEFLREGQALQDFLQPDRIVLGIRDGRDADRLEALYSSLKAPVLRTGLATAEMIKYTSNALLATLVSFSNEIARLCEAIPGVDVQEVLKGVHGDRRLTHKINGRSLSAGVVEYLAAGCGFGGSCLPKDLRALLSFARQRGVQTRLLDCVKAINDAQPEHLVQAAESWMGSLQGKRALVLGLSFKHGVDDIRESVGIRWAKILIQRGAQVAVYDPLVDSRRVEDLIALGARYVKDPAAAFRRCDVCFIATAAPEFRFIQEELSTTHKNGRRPVVVDGRRLLRVPEGKGSARYIAVGLGKKRVSKQEEFVS